MIITPLNGKLVKIGEFKDEYTQLMSEQTVINANAWYSTAKIRLTAGTWIVFGQTNVATNPTALANIYQRIVNGDASSVYANDAFITQQRNTQISAMCHLENTKDIFLQVYTSSPAKTYATVLRAIKIN